MIVQPRLSHLVLMEKKLKKLYSVFNVIVFSSSFQSLLKNYEGVRSSGASSMIVIRVVKRSWQFSFCDTANSKDFFLNIIFLICNSNNSNFTSAMTYRMLELITKLCG